MFEKYTNQSRRVLVLGQEEARVLNADHLGTEHILVGLILECEGVASKALKFLDFSIDAVRAEIRAIVGKGQRTADGLIPFTPHAKAVLEFSQRESKMLGHNYIGTEHIVLGLIRGGEGVAIQVLEKVGVSPNQVRQRVIQLWGIQLTGLVLGSPCPVGLGVLHAGWVTAACRRSRMDWFGPGVGDEAVVAHGVVGNGELQHPEENQTRA